MQAPARDKAPFGWPRMSANSLVTARSLSATVATH
jgi:hypothetical protein